MSGPFYSALMGIAPFVPFFVILLFLNMQRQKTCPDCGEALPRIQSIFKMTKRQWLEGGYICPKCGCEVDTAGRKVPAGAAIRLRSFVTKIVMLTVLCVIGAVLLSFILHRSSPQEASPHTTIRTTNKSVTLE
jgi:predicted RNA-binding Zn-ribbon protein involved in translation (DUF1610 family)